MGEGKAANRDRSALLMPSDNDLSSSATYLKSNELGVVKQSKSVLVHPETLCDPFIEVAHWGKQTLVRFLSKNVPEVTCLLAASKNRVFPIKFNSLSVTFDVFWLSV